MGISVPIGSEHYKNLKEISDKLGFGLKKTVEYLVTYYWQREMLNSTDKPSQNLPAKEVSKNERYREIFASFASTTNPKPTQKFPPSVISAATPKNQPAEFTAPKFMAPPSKPVTSNCPSCGASKRPNAKFCVNCGNLLS